MTFHSRTHRKSSPIIRVFDIRTRRQCRSRDNDAQGKAIDNHSSRDAFIPVPRIRPGAGLLYYSAPKTHRCLRRCLPWMDQWPTRYTEGLQMTFSKRKPVVITMPSAEGGEIRTCLFTAAVPNNATPAQVQGCRRMC
ncbi:hypothetical protein MRX96_012538 [Rhipicephalus microplus]